MPRLFVAIAVPEHIDHYFEQLISDVLPVSSQAEKHITLCFIGHVKEQIAACIEQDLEQVSSQGFELQIEGCDIFKPNSSRPILVAKVSQHPLLTALHQQLNKIVSGQDVQLDTRPYKPHITLARLPKPTSELISEITEKAQTIKAKLKVKGFVLYQVDRSLPSPYVKRQQYDFSA